MVSELRVGGQALEDSASRPRPPDRGLQAQAGCGCGVRQAGVGPGPRGLAAKQCVGGAHATNASRGVRPDAIARVSRESQATGAGAAGQWLLLREGASDGGRRWPGVIWCWRQVLKRHRGGEEVEAEPVKVGQLGEHADERREHVDRKSIIVVVRVVRREQEPVDVQAGPGQLVLRSAGSALLVTPVPPPPTVNICTGEGDWDK